jgi:dihydrofolate reductase
VRKLIESTHVTLGGEIGSPHEWGFPYLDDEHFAYASSLLSDADALLLGRRTYEGLSAGYTSMAGDAPGGSIAKYGNGPLDVTLMEHNLIDEFHLLLTPVAVGRGQHMFADLDGSPQLTLAEVTRFSNGVLVLVDVPT